MPQFFEGLVALLVGVAVLFVFAWAARALLDARQLTWRRLFVAALAGFMLGSTASALLLVRDVEQAANLDYRQLYLVGLPFQIIATMGAVVVLDGAEYDKLKLDRVPPSIAAAAAAAAPTTAPAATTAPAK